MNGDNFLSKSVVILMNKVWDELIEWNVIELTGLSNLFFSGIRGFMVVSVLNFLCVFNDKGGFFYFPLGLSCKVELDLLFLFILTLTNMTLLLIYLLYNT